MSAGPPGDTALYLYEDVTLRGGVPGDTALYLYEQVGLRGVPADTALYVYEHNTLRRGPAGSALYVYEHVLREAGRLKVWDGDTWHTIGCENPDEPVLLLRDTFDRTNGTSQVLARSDGGVWTVQQGTPTISTNALSSATTGWAGVHADLPAPLRRIRATVKFVITNPFRTAKVWWDSYDVEWEQYEAWIALHRDGSRVASSHFGPGFEDAAEHTMVIDHILGVSVNVWLDGGSRIAYDDSGTSHTILDPVFEVGTEGSGVRITDVQVEGVYAGGRLKVWDGTQWWKERCPGDTVPGRSLKAWTGADWLRVACMVREPFLDDPFTGVDGQTLQGHQAEVGDGSSWAAMATRMSASNASTVDAFLDSNHLVAADGTGSGSRGYYYPMAASSPDYEVAADFYINDPTETARWELGGRIDPSNGFRRYTLAYLSELAGLANGAHWRLTRLAGGVLQLDDFYVDYAPGTTVRAVLRMDGTSITAWVDGVQIMGVTDVAFAAAGHVGVGAPPADNGYVDNLTARYL